MAVMGKQDHWEGYGLGSYRYPKEERQTRENSVYDPVLVFVLGIYVKLMQRKYQRLPV